MPIIRHHKSQTLLEAVLAIGVILVSVFASTTLIVTTVTAGQSSEDKIVAANFAREGIEIVRAVRDSNWMKREQNVLHQTWVNPPPCTCIGGSGSECTGGTWNCPPGYQLPWEVYDWDYTIYSYDSTGYDLTAVYNPARELIYAVWPNPPSNWKLAKNYGGDIAVIWENTIPAVGSNPKMVFYSQLETVSSSNLTPACPSFYSEILDSRVNYQCKKTKFSRNINIKNHLENFFSSEDGEYVLVTSTVTWQNHGNKSLTMTERLYDWR